MLQENRLANALRPAGAKKIKPPILPACTHVAQAYRENILRQLSNAGATNIKPSAAGSSSQQLYGEVDICVEFMEVSTGMVGAGNLYKEGFTKLGPTMKGKR